MQKADYLLRLMKQETDALVAKDEKLQRYLMWVNEKSCSVKVPFNPAAVRAFYFALDPALDPALISDLNPVLDSALDPALISDLNPVLDRAVVRVLVRAIIRFPERALVRAFDQALNLALDLALVLALDLEPELRQVLQELKTQLPAPNNDEGRLKQWWQVNGQAWTSQLRVVMIQHRNIGHDWQFSEQQVQVLKQYYNANKLLVDCLNSSCNATPAVRSQIEETLLLPTEMLPNAES